MNTPKDLRYSKEHEWLRVEGNTAYVGITDFAQSQLGDIVFLDIPSVGESLSAGDVFGSIEAVKTVSDAFLPVGGKVVAFNEKLNDHPELINKEPYGQGWIVEIEMSDPAQAQQLLSAEEYEKLIA